MTRAVVVVGGANLDVKARSHAAVVAGTSNPGAVTLSPGGVGRNVAENLARLGTPVHLVSAVGRDDHGEQVLAATASAGVDVSLVRRTDESTGTYVALLHPDGELSAAVSAMAATSTLDPDDVRAADAVIRAAGLVVLDGNLRADTLRTAWDLAVAASVPVVLDPVSVPKAAALAPLLDGSRPLLAISPNADELAVLGPAADLHARGVEQVWVRRGRDGSTLSVSGDLVELAAPAVHEVVDVTGAGDAMLAAYCHGLLAGETPARAAALGHAAAALTVVSAHTVRPDLTDELARSEL